MTASKPNGDPGPTGDSGAVRRFSAVVLSADPDRLDEALALFSADAMGVDLAGDPPTGLRLWFDDAGRADQVLLAVKRWQERGGRAGDDARLEQLADGRWVERYQERLAPFRLGTRFMVDPTGATPAPPSDDGRIWIRLRPGRAFGTGEHTTTRLCVGMLESRVEPGSRWLDVGCGSGILSVVAHRLGASSIGAVDVDADALAVAREVVTQNQAHEAVTLWNGSLPEVTLDRWDGVVANVDLPFFVDHASHLARIPRPGGVLIASGFLARDARVVALRVTHAGLVVVRMEVAPPWAALVAKRVES